MRCRRTCDGVKTRSRLKLQIQQSKLRDKRKVASPSSPLDRRRQRRYRRRAKIVAATTTTTTANATAKPKRKMINATIELCELDIDGADKYAECGSECGSAPTTATNSVNNDDDDDDDSDKSFYRFPGEKLATDKRERSGSTTTAEFSSPNAIRLRASARLIRLNVDDNDNRAGAEADDGVRDGNSVKTARYANKLMRKWLLRGLTALMKKQWRYAKMLRSPMLRKIARVLYTLAGSIGIFNTVHQILNAFVLDRANGSESACLFL